MGQNVAVEVLCSSKAFYLAPNQTRLKSTEESLSTYDCTDILFFKRLINLVPVY